MDDPMNSMTPYEGHGENSNFIQIFFDTEFNGLYQNTKLISIGCVTAHGDQFYAEFNDWHDQPNGNELFIKDYVEPNLLYKEDTYTDTGHLPGAKEKPVEGEHATAYIVSMRGSSEKIATALLEWLSVMHTKYGRPIQFVGDHLAWDWVLLVNLICKDGCGSCLPEYLYYIPVDVCTMMEMNRIDPDITREKILTLTNAPVDTTRKHNALYDAFIIRLWYQYLVPLKAYAWNATYNRPHFVEEDGPKGIDWALRQGTPRPPEDPFPEFHMPIEGEPDHQEEQS